MFQRQMISSFMLIVNLYTICKKNTGVNKKNSMTYVNTNKRV